MTSQPALPFDRAMHGRAEPGPASAEAAFARVSHRLGWDRPVTELRVEYRAFADFRSTIRFRNGRVLVRISDLLSAAPALVLEALAELLLAKLFRVPPSREARECYRAYISTPAFRRRIDNVRRQRGTKRLLPPRGRCYDLVEIFAKLNRKFFGEEFPPPRLGWSQKRSRTHLGHYDSAHGTITISRWLDSPWVPRFVVEFLVFHEMLHILFPEKRRGHRRVLHSTQFREAEKIFPAYDQACRLLKLICA